jgi:hypothetical protein
LRAVARGKRDADAGADLEAMALDIVGVADGLDDASGQGFGLVWVAGAGLNNGEFVAALARHQVSEAHAAQQSFAHLLQYRIADRVAEVVVDGLEAVEIEAKHGKALATRHSLQRLLQLFLEQGAIGEVGRQDG